MRQFLTHEFKNVTLQRAKSLPRRHKANLQSKRVYAGRALQELLKLREEESGEKREPLKKGTVSPALSVPEHIGRPFYADTGELPGLAPEPEIHDAEGVEKMRQSGRLAAQVLDFAISLAKPGVTTDSIDKQVHQMIIDNNAYPSPLNYGRFPKSVCTSVNECICHGIPDSRVLQDGDIVNVDVTVYLNGYHGDTSRMVCLGTTSRNVLFLSDEGGVGSGDDVPESTKALIDANRRALEAAIALCAPGVPFRMIGQKISDIAEETGFRIVKDFVGHGVGRQFHASPFVFHHRNREPGTMQLHQTFTIEPIFTQGRLGHRQWRDGWTEIADDGALSAQCEHTILITSNGHEALTVV